MRPVLAYVVSASIFAALPAIGGSRAPITLLLQFEGSPSAPAVEEMKRELEGVMKSAGIAFEYRLPSELHEPLTPADIIVVKFKGRCRMEMLPALWDERGPFAITHSVDGEILPFSEIACDRVRVSIRSAMLGEHWKKPDLALGRALGRVLAHEIYHILAKTPHHGTEGVARTSLSAADLIADRLDLHAHDVKKLRR